ncbi:MAG TPA: glycosyltransferase family 39 protein, partial [Polyangiaceae bacterium]|nr:glycosyltransferase family 39 protein [Polyangiaceae bacterium]
LGRLPSIVLSVLTVVLVGVWAYRLWGGRAALLALCLAAFDPNLIAYGSLIGHDGPLTCFATLALFSIAELIKEGRIRWLVLAGVASGLALGSKYSATYIVLVACVVMIVTGIRSGAPELEPRGSSRNLFTVRAVQAVILVAIALVVIRVVYYPASYPSYLTGLRAQLGHQSHGHPAFLLGDVSRSGWVSYFPIALAVKEPPLTLLLALVSLSCVRFGTALGRAWLTVALPAGLLLLGLLAVRVNIGVRYALPLVPLLIVLASRVATFSPPHWVSWVFSLGLVHHVGAAVRVAPHDIAFFSDIVGGPKNGHRILADSNLDWGQDIQTLGDWLVQHEPPRRLYLSYFGTALPEAYGVHYRPVLNSCAHVAPWDPKSAVDEPKTGRELLAISEMNVQGVFFREPNPYAWLATRTPIAVLGHSMRVYDVSHDTEAKQRLAASSEELGLAR